MSDTQTRLTGDRMQPVRRSAARPQCIDHPRRFFATAGLAVGLLLMALFYFELAFGMGVTSHWIGAFTFGVIGGPLLLLSAVLYRTRLRVLIALPGLATLGWFWAYIAMSL